MSGQDAFIRIFREVQPKFSRLYARLLSQAGLSLPQYALLNQLAQSGRIPMTEASAKLHISKPAVTKLVDRLEKIKYLRRASNPADRRVSLIEIQPAGKKIVLKTQGFVLGFVLKTLKHLSAGERKVVERFYARLSETIDGTLRARKGKKL